jgi:hypothetical protein
VFTIPKEDPMVSVDVNEPIPPNATVLAAVLEKIVITLEPLSQNDRERVLGCVAVFYGFADWKVARDGEEVG